MLPMITDYLDKKTTVTPEEKVKGLECLKKYGPPEEWVHTSPPKEDTELAMRTWHSLSKGEQDDLRMDFESKEEMPEAEAKEPEQKEESPDMKDGEAVAGRLDELLSGKQSPKDMIAMAVDRASMKGVK